MANRSLSSVFRSFPALFSAGSVGGLTDGQLLERFLSRRDEGAEAAFAALVELHGPMVWNVCRGVLIDPHAAEDAFQATFLILVRKAGSIRRRDTIGPWLHGVSRRVAVRAKTVAARRRSLEGQDTEMRETSTPDPSRREQLEVLHQEVDRLPEKYRAPVVLCHFEGRTHAEAARLLNCPVGTVSVRLLRAREQLKARLIRRGVVLPAAFTGALLGAENASAALPSRLADTTIEAAMHLAAGKTLATLSLSAIASQLVEGELKTMVLTRFGLAGAGVLAMGIVVAGAGLAVGQRPARVAAQAAPRAATTPVAAVDDAEARSKSANNIRTIGLAMLGFASDHGHTLPASATYKGGKPLLSWRVAILPYIDQGALYKKFHLDEPWDSPHNKELLKEMPEVYAPVVANARAPFSTYFQVFVGPGTIFEGEAGIKLTEVKDGTSLTLLVVEAGEPVPWTKPQDLAYDKDKPLPKLGGQFDDGFQALMADGAAFFLTKKVDLKTIRAIITRNGAEPVIADKLHP